MNDRHTLAVPTYNRPAFLRRLIRYYHVRARPMNILVLDSSEPEVAAQNAAALSYFGPTLRHVVYPPEETPIAKIAHGLTLVRTPYASFCADDDLVFPDGLRQALQFIDSHPDYVCAHGIYLNFRQAGTGIQLTHEYTGPSNEASHPGARIFRMLQNYESPFYAVYRSAELCEMLAAAQATGTMHYQELFQSLSAVILGKVRRLPMLYGARQSGPPAQLDRQKWQTFYWFAENPEEVLEQYRIYSEALWTFYQTHASVPRMDRALFFRTLHLSHAVYFSSGCSPQNLYSALQANWPADPYLRLGQLDGLRGVDLSLLLRWMKSEGGNPVADMLNLILALSNLPAFFGGKALAATWYFARALPGHFRLNREVRDACRKPWRCRFAATVAWLPGHAEFRGGLVELCRYMDMSE